MDESPKYSIMLVKDKNGNKCFVPDILETEKSKDKKDRTMYCCYVCGNELSLHSGPHIRPYYQHKSGEKCDYSNESDIHKRYKEILSRQGQQFQVGDTIYTVKNAEVEKPFSVLESWIKTDLFVKTEEGKHFILEVAYRNKKKGYEYLKKWRLLGFDVIELNINEQEEIIKDCASDNIDKIYKCEKLYDAKTGEYCGEIPKEYGIFVIPEKEDELVRKYMSLPEVNDFIEFVNQNYNDVEQIIKRFGKLAYMEQDFICRKIIGKSHQSLKNKLEESKYSYCQKMEQKQKEGISFCYNFINKKIYEKSDNWYVRIEIKELSLKETLYLTECTSDKEIEKFFNENTKEYYLLKNVQKIIGEYNNWLLQGLFNSHFDIVKKTVVYISASGNSNICSINDPKIEKKCEAKISEITDILKVIDKINDDHKNEFPYKPLRIYRNKVVCKTDAGTHIDISDMYDVKLKEKCIRKINDVLRARKIIDKMNSKYREIYKKLKIHVELEIHAENMVCIINNKTYVRISDITDTTLEEKCESKIKSFANKANSNHGTKTKKTLALYDGKQIYSKEELDKLTVPEVLNLLRTEIVKNLRKEDGYEWICYDYNRQFNYCLYQEGDKITFQGIGASKKEFFLQENTKSSEIYNFFENESCL